MCESHSGWKITKKAKKAAVLSANNKVDVELYGAQNDPPHVYCSAVAIHASGGNVGGGGGFNKKTEGRERDSRVPQP